MASKRKSTTGVAFQVSQAIEAAASAINVMAAVVTVTFCTAIILGWI